MADDGRTSQRPVAASSLSPSRPLRDFYQALRQIERDHPEWPRLGEGHDPAQEAVRLGQDPSLAFQGSTEVSEEAPEEGRPSRINVRFFGVFGPNGPMPLHLSEYAYQRLHSYRDSAFIRFADIFHHRLLTLFYRAWANAEPTVSRDRPKDDPIASYVEALIGQAGARDHGESLGQTSRYMARHFLGQTRHPEGLAKALTEVLSTPVQIEEFVGEWIQIPEEYRWRLAGKSSPGPSAMGVLGQSSRVGRQIWERQYKFRVVVGPMPRATYERFLPQGDLMAPVIAMVRRYIGHELAWDVRLELDQSDMRPTILGVNGRLGQTSYLGDPSVGLPPSWQALVLDPLAQAS